MMQSCKFMHLPFYMLQNWKKCHFYQDPISCQTLCLPPNQFCKLLVRRFLAKRFLVFTESRAQAMTEHERRRSGFEQPAALHRCRERQHSTMKLDGNRICGRLLRAE